MLQSTLKTSAEPLALTCVSPPLAQLKSRIFIQAFHSSSQRAKWHWSWESIYLNKNPARPLESVNAEL